jgi:hypothetical protein
VRPGFEKDHPFALYERKYRPDQLRDDHGRWADEGGSKKPNPSRSKKPETIEFSAAKAKGHHFVPTAEVRNRKISAEAAEVFDKASTGPLLDVRSNLWTKITEYTARPLAMRSANI